jgi:hypothetical protein
MSFDLPWHFCSVAENGLKIAKIGSHKKQVATNASDGGAYALSPV